ncbi:uncharacterized protein LOC122658018 [Telopea speciosissima]|uniref:uncharacterized protein LOC122658018 n=1 Tax=Telopea speciosissima TaxID=54955 RepID=UPI001CC6DBCE|nr:uncharacterized protein LOC122658018 [Telopea speciosissima]
MEIEEISSGSSLPLLSLNHISLLCRSVSTSAAFYEEVLGFVVIKRPSSFNFNGAWLFNYGVGIHLLENNSSNEYDMLFLSRPINPQDNHISFQCTDIGFVKRRLQELGIKYVTAVVNEGRIRVDQVFFHDPDGYMIEICNCDKLPVLPLSSPFLPEIPISSPFKESKGSTCKKMVDGCGLMENAMMESLSMEMMNFSF